MEYPFEDEMGYETRRENMNEESGRNRALVDTTDCLEAVDVFRMWKNFFFVVILVLLIVLQVLFWLVDTGVIANDAVIGAAAEPLHEADASAGTSGEVAVPPGLDANSMAAVAGEEAKERKEGTKVNYGYARVAIQVANFVLVPAAVLYWLTMLFIIKISLHGRLGGINHATRAFFLSMFVVVFLLPWQYAVGEAFSGYMFSAAALSKAVAAEKAVVMNLAFYGRYVAYWVWVVLLLVLAQIRSTRWSGATRKRLEVI